MNNTKIILTALLGICFINPTHAQEMSEHKVPQNVVQSFKKRYPNTFVYEWEWKRKLQVYEAEYMDKGLKKECYLDNKGNWILTRWEIETHEVPETIHKSIAQSAYAHWKLDDASIYSSAKTVKYYELELKEQRKKMYLYYMPDGTLIEKSTVKKIDD